MPTETLRRLAVLFLRRAVPGIEFELMSNEDVDRWLEAHRTA
jgi:hypothetical protein